MNKVEIRYTHPFIGGQFRTDLKGNTFPSFSPCDGSKICDIHACDTEQIDEAVDCARKALRVWNSKKTEEKSNIMRRIAIEIRKRKDLIAETETMDSGIPIVTTRGHFADRSAAFFDYYAGIPDKLYGKTVPIDPGFLTMTIHEPYGVVGIIVPWNAPFTELSAAVAVAMACGNTVVVKPASDTVLSGLIMGEICQEAGLEPGIVNIVAGPGATVGNYIASHPGIDKIAFTGGGPVGKTILSNSIDTLKSCTLELGGKTPVIVCEDADLEFAAQQASFSSVRNSGQICTAASRLFVQQNIWDKFMAMVTEKMKGYQIGDPFDPKTVLGPMISKRHRDKVLGYIEEGKKSGAKLVLGGDTPKEPPLDKGFFVNPTLFTDVDHNSIIAQEEIFGPMLCALPYNTLDEVIATANDSKYGLAATIFTSSIRNSQYFIDNIQAGLVWVNCINFSNPAITIGSYKQSGMGIRSGLDGALYSFTRMKTVWINKNQ